MNKTLIFALLATALAAQADGGPRFNAPGARDLTPTALVALPAPTGQLERRPVNYAFALDPMAELQAAAPFAAESREYWMEVDGSALQRGAAIETTSPGAVIRLSPAEGATAVDPAQLQILRNGRALAQPQSLQRTATAAQLQAAGMDVPDGSAIVQLAADNGSGGFQLRLPKASGRYLIHVFEPQSEFVLRAQADRAQALAGERARVSVRLDRQAQAMAAEVGGLLVAPDGRSFELAFSRQGDAASALLALPADAGRSPGLWEVQVFAEGRDGERRVLRDARTVIAVAAPTARLSGGFRFDAGTLRLNAPLQVGSPGRYALRATLYATGPDGIARPVSQAESAAWVAPGARLIALAFDRAHVPTGYGAPYEIRQLQLIDQGRMATVETREFAARIGRR
jgi:hypothetical protein